MKKILLTLLIFLTFISSANPDDFTDTDKAEQKILAEKYVKALQERDFNTVNQLIDYDTYAERFVDQLSFKKLKDLKDLKKVVSKRLKVKFIEGRMMYQKIYSDSAYVTLIGWRKTDDFSGYFIRLVNENQSITYLGLVAKKLNKKWRIIDFYDVTRQETVSTFVAKMSEQMLLDSNSIMEKLEQNNNSDKVDEEKIGLLFAQIKNKKFPEAVNTYRGLSDALKKEKVVLDLGLSLTNLYENEKFYNELLAIIGQYYQNNPEYYNILIDYFLTRKDYDKAREISKKSSALMSDDGVMNLTLANISITEENYPRALQESKQCAKAEPDFIPCYDNWIAVADKLKNYDEEVAAYNMMFKNVSFKLNKSMFNEKDNGDFIHSDAFKNWDIPKTN